MRNETARIGTKARTHRIAALCALAGALGLGAVALAEDVAPAAVHVAKGSRLWLEGDSTLHRFSADATQLQVSFTTDNTVVAEATKTSDVEALVKAGGVKGLVLNVPVKKLNSGESGLDDNMVKALRGSDYPQITFKMDSYEVTEAGAKDAAFAMKVHGHLTISGVDKPEEIVLQASHAANGALRLVGSKDLVMSEFKVQPPVLMMGMLKVKDQITVKFDLQLQPGQ